MKFPAIDPNAAECVAFSQAVDCNPLSPATRWAVNFNVLGWTIPERGMFPASVPGFLVFQLGGDTPVLFRFSVLEIQDTVLEEGKVVYWPVDPVLQKLGLRLHVACRKVPYVV